ncbi:MAG: hypothetical protein LBP59_19615 [Planctomycetaceae bacterium]|jgi:dihydrofolate synthase/folylpolyglutamate synthase|nr:hypothetical protein [Planctomycetaceae bacterium]
MSFEEALNFLNSRKNFELSRNFSTDGFMERLVRLREFVDYLGYPDRKYKIVHVAGTKGKGSTCVLVEGILMEAGAVVGRFTSPHLYSFLERITVNGVICSESDFAETMLYIRGKIEDFDSSLLFDLTFFELLTVFSFEYFARRSVDYAVIEVGLGGRFDATNICFPSVTVIANLSFDHMEQLGPTLRDIAREKGGIIKAGVPLVSSVCDSEARAELCEIIDARGAPAYFLGDAFNVAPVTVSDLFRFWTIGDNFPAQVDIDGLNVSMCGRHQRKNAALAIAAALLLDSKTKEKCESSESSVECKTKEKNESSDSSESSVKCKTGEKSESSESGVGGKLCGVGGFNFGVDIIRRGLLRGFLPVRVEVLSGFGVEPVFIVDGAHNKASVEMFIDTLCELFPDRRKLLVFGTMVGKDVEGMLSDLLPQFDVVFMTQYSSSPRCFPPVGLKTIADAILPLRTKSRQCKIHVICDSATALNNCFEQADKNDVICVTGSIYLAAELRNFYLNNIAKNQKK